MNALECTLRVTTSDDELAQVSVRRRQFSVGRPLELDAMSPRTSALEYVLGALAAEAVNGLRLFARRRRIPVDDVEAVVTGVLEHGLAYLEVAGESGPPRIGRVHLKVFVSSPDHAAVRHLWPDLIARLPLVCTLQAAFPITLELTTTS